MLVYNLHMSTYISVSHTFGSDSNQYKVTNIISAGKRSVLLLLHGMHICMKNNIVVRHK